MNTWKNAHSPAGMGYSTCWSKYRNLKDCPKCKHGTMDYRSPENQIEFWQCADCGHQIKAEPKDK